MASIEDVLQKLDADRQGALDRLFALMRIKSAVQRRRRKRTFFWLKRQCWLKQCRDSR